MAALSAAVEGLVQHHYDVAVTGGIDRNMGAPTFVKFCKIGAHAFIGMYTSLTQDVPPFVLVSGNPAEAHGVNIEGLKRRGYTREQINAIRAAYKTLYRSGLTLEEAKARLQEEEAAAGDAAAPVRAMRSFLDSASRGIVR